MTNYKRMPWTKEDDRVLLELWPRVGSIIMIALKLNRTPSSVQTHASRKNLPRRIEENNKHRRKWDMNDTIALNKAIEKHKLPNGKIPIKEISDEIGKSIDTITYKLIEIENGNEEIIFDKIYITQENYLFDNENEEKSNFKAINTTKIKKGAGKRKCMSCQKEFWSEGIHNRLCPRCKKEEDGYNWD